MATMTVNVAQGIGKELLDGVTKVVALFISMTYVMGLIIVNSYLLTQGVRSSTLLSAEYISAGMPLALLFVVAALTAAFINRVQQGIWAKFLLTILSLVLLGLIMLYITNLEDYVKTLRATGLIFALVCLMFVFTLRDFKRRLIGSQERLIVWSAVYGLILLAVIVAASTFYGRTVYNDILPTIGGGKSSTVSLITDVENGKVLEKFVPMVSEVETEKVQLIRETAESYLIVRADQTSVSIDKDVVKAVVYYRTKGWEIRPSWLD